MALRSFALLVLLVVVAPGAAALLPEPGQGHCDETGYLVCVGAWVDMDLVCYAGNVFGQCNGEMYVGMFGASPAGLPGSAVGDFLLERTFCYDDECETETFAGPAECDWSVTDEQAQCGLDGAVSLENLVAPGHCLSVTLTASVVVEGRPATGSVALTAHDAAFRSLADELCF